MRSLKEPSMEFMDRDDLLANFIRNKYAERVAVVITNGIEAINLLPIFATLKRDNYALWMRAQEKSFIIRVMASVEQAKEWTYNFPADKDIKWELWFKGIKIDQGRK